jgi:Skp family chaperone for outer membrane proteins
MENKKLTGILLVVLILGLGGIYYLHFRQGIHRIAYIDSQKVIQGYEGMKKARKEYEKRSKEWKAKMDTLITEWENELSGTMKGKKEQCQQKKSSLRKNCSEHDSSR